VKWRPHWGEVVPSNAPYACQYGYHQPDGKDEKCELCGVHGGRVDVLFSRLPPNQKWGTKP